MDLLNDVRRDRLVCGLVTLEDNSGLVLQRIIEPIQDMSSQVTQEHLANIRFDVVLDAVAAVGEIGVSPVAQTVELDVLV